MESLVVTVVVLIFFFFQAEDGIRDKLVTGVQTCALPISRRGAPAQAPPAGSAPSRDAGQPHAAPPAAAAGPPDVVRSGVSRDRDPGPDQADPGGCARLPRAVAGTPGGVLRPAAAPPDLHAAAHGVLRP